MSPSPEGVPVFLLEESAPRSWTGSELHETCFGVTRTAGPEVGDLSAPSNSELSELAASDLWTAEASRLADTGMREEAAVDARDPRL